MFREPRPTSGSLYTNFLILCVTTCVTTLNTTIIDRSATAASLLFGSSLSQDVLQILYYQLAALTSCYHQLIGIRRSVFNLFPFFPRLGGNACCGQHLRCNAGRSDAGASRDRAFRVNWRANRQLAPGAFPAFPHEHERAGDIYRRIRADDDADEETPGETLQHYAAEGQHRADGQEC